MISENSEPKTIEVDQIVTQVEPTQAKEISSLTVETPSASPKQKQLSSADRDALKISFNASFDETIKKYLTETCGYENTDNIEKLREKLEKKFVYDSKGASIKGEERVIKPYLKSLLAVFECLYKRYKSGSFLPNPALLYRRIDSLISQISAGSIKKINNKEKEKLCTDVIENIKGGKRSKEAKKTQRRKTRKNKTRKSRKSRRNK